MSSFAADIRSNKRKRPATKEIDELLKDRPSKELWRKNYTTLSKNIHANGQKMARKLGTAEGRAIFK